MNVRVKVIRNCCLILFIVLFYESAIAQKKWDGEAGDNFWENPLNWADNIAPLSSDDVILDNSVLTNSYSVIVNGTIGTVQCRSLRIAPDTPKRISLIIASSNLNAIALATSGSGYSVELNSGAELVNASGASSGSVLSISDSMRVTNGAKYIHRTARGNAAILNSLSSSAGTERGIVEFDVPVVTGSYIVSMTNRVFGTLVFSSFSNGSPLTYISNGTNPVTVRGDLLINSQVSLSVGFDDTIRLKGNLAHEGSILNLSNNGNPTVLQIGGNIRSAPGSLITETNTASPVIFFNGDVLQEVDSKGTIANDIKLKLAKQGILKLTSPLHVPYVLELRKGILRTDATNLLTLGVNAEILVDSSLLDSSFIDGPVRKLGFLARDHFLFPVGKEKKMRWLELKNISGDFIVEFFKTNPYTLSSSMNGIDHISSIEYWTVEAASGASARVELSFDNVNSGGVTDMATLRVAQLNGSWNNQGNSGTTGSAGAAGSVTSNLISVFDPSNRYFTLASTEANENPLPSKWVNLSINRNQQQLVLKWAIPQNFDLLEFVLEDSFDGIHFQKKTRSSFVDNTYAYSTTVQDKNGMNRWYRIGAQQRDGTIFYSNIVFAAATNNDINLSMSNSLVSGQFIVWITSGKAAVLHLQVLNISGQVMSNQKVTIQKGTQQFRLQIPYLSTGNYFLVGFNENLRTNVIRFNKD